MEFSDFQCPFCARVQPELKRVLEKYPEDVAIVYRHFPLESIHPQAFAASEASECAGEQGRFAAYHDLLYARQDEIGTRSWSDFARAAGVSDLPRFETCMAERRYREVVARDLRAAEELGLDGTPAFIINGRLIGGAPATETWDRLIGEALRDAPTAPAPR